MLNIGRSKLKELEEIIEEHQNYLFSFAFFRVGSFEVAQDIVQDVFLKLYRENSRLSSIENIKSYLLKTISNKCIDYKRGQKRSISIDLMHNIASEYLYEFIKIEALLEDIPSEQAEIIRLRIVDNLSFTEIASILEISANTVKARYRYGIDKLKQSKKIKSYEYYD